MAHKILLLNVPLLKLNLREVVNHFKTNFPPCPIDEQLTGQVVKTGIVLALEDESVSKEILDQGTHTIHGQNGTVEILVVPFSQGSEKSHGFPWGCDNALDSFGWIDEMVKRHQELVWSNTLGQPPPSYEDIVNDPVVSGDAIPSHPKLLCISKQLDTLDPLGDLGIPGVKQDSTGETYLCEVRSILVESINGESLDLKELTKFFSDFKASNGGLLNSSLCYLLAFGQQAVVTYREAEVAARVLKSNKLKSVPPRNVPIRVLAGKPMPPPCHDPLCLIIYNVSIATSNPALSLLAKSEGHLSEEQQGPRVCFRGDLGTGEVALLQFRQNRIDLDGVIAGINANTYCGVKHVAKKLYYTNSVLVDNAANFHLDEIKRLVQNRVGMHSVAVISPGGTENMVIVYFNSYEAVDLVLKGGEFQYRGRKLGCFPFLSQLNLPLGRQGTRPVSLIAPIFLNAEPIYIRCICNHVEYLSKFENNLLTKCSAKLEIQRDEDSELVELVAHYVGSNVDNAPTEDSWKESINALLEATISEFSQKSLQCPRDKWDVLSQQIEPEAEEWFILLEEEDAMVLAFCGKEADIEQHFAKVSAILSSDEPPAAIPRRQSIYKVADKLILDITLDDLSAQSSNVIAIEVDQNLKPKDQLGQKLIQIAGPNIQKELDSHLERTSQYPVASVLQTNAGSMEGVETILHVVTPRCDPQNMWESENLLKQAFIRCLTYAGSDLGHRSISLPPLGAGIDLYPLEMVGKILFETCCEKYVDTHKLKDIKVVCADELTYKEITEAKHSHMSKISSIDKRESALAGAAGREPTLPNAFATNPLKSQETKYEFCTTENIRVQICFGNIISDKSEAIVSSANRDLKHVVGISKAIAGAAGDPYLEECKKILKKQKNKRLECTECVYTGVGKMDGPKYVIHAVGPRQNQKKDRDWNKKLEDTMVNAFALANRELKVTSISLPLMGTGALGVSVETVANIMYNAIMRYSKNIPPGIRHLTCLRVVDKSEEKLEILKKTFREKSENDQSVLRMLMVDEDATPTEEVPRPHTVFATSRPPPHPAQQPARSTGIFWRSPSSPKHNP